VKATGSLFGLAYGDAMGAPTEFLSVDEIMLRYGQARPRDLVGDPALITDDTQMTLALARAMPAEWSPRIEHRDELARLGRLWD
jgi:ADP-ribosylglycohydrolase